MDAISLSIELGKAIQNDEIYINYKLASQKNDEDKNLQNLIGEFNLKKLSINLLILLFTLLAIFTTFF